MYRDKETQQHYPTKKWLWPPIFPAMECTCILDPLCCVQNKLRMLCIGVEASRRLPSYGRRVVLLSFLEYFLSLFSVPSSTWNQELSETFTPFPCKCLGREVVSTNFQIEWNQFSNKLELTLQSRNFSLLLLFSSWFLNQISNKRRTG